MIDFPVARIGDIAEIVRGVTFSKSDATKEPGAGLLPVLRAGNIQDGLMLDRDLVYVPRDNVNEKQLLRVGDIVVCMSSGSAEIVGKTAIVEEDWQGSFGAFCATIRVNPGKSNPLYLLHYLKSPAFRSWTQQSAGANIKNIRKSELELFAIPLPSLSEQVRIATILGKADRIRNARKKALLMADRLVHSLFLEMFGDPLNNPKALSTAPIKAFGKVITGNTPSRAREENFGGAVEWIKSDNINTTDHFLTPATEFLSEVGRSRGRTAPAGSTLVTCIAGSPSVIGNAALADREVAFNQQINAVIPYDTTDPHFLYCQFLVGKRLIQANSTNSMKGMVSKGKFQEIEFLQPDQEQQQEFGDFFRKVVAMTHRLRQAHSDSLELFRSVSARGFRGEL